MDELDGVFQAVSGYFSLLAEPTRIRILNAICHEERTVNDIAQSIGSTQTNVSRHLSTMYRAGVLSRRREGPHTYYGVSDSALTEICRTVCVHIAGREGPDDRLRLLAIAGQFGFPSALAGSAATQPTMQAGDER